MNELNNIKDSIRNKSAEILQTWVNRVPSRRLDIREMMAYLMETCELSGGEMMKLMASVFSFIEYRSMHQFMKDFRDIARRIEERLRGRKFYLIMDCGSHEGGGVNEDKSNYYLFVLLMCVRPTLVDDLVDFVCVSDGKMNFVHTDMDETVDVCVFMDDAAFTGSQAYHNTRLRDRSKYDIIYGSVYASERALRGLEEQFFESYASHAIVTSSFSPEPVNTEDITERYLSNTSSPLTTSVIKQALNSIGIRPKETLSHDSDKFLFYTDLKFPDGVSVFTYVMQDLRLIQEDGFIQGNIQGGAGMYADMDSQTIDSELGGRTYKIVSGDERDPVYKTDSWSTFVRDAKTTTMKRKMVH